MNTGASEELARALRSMSADHGRGALGPLAAFFICWSGAFVFLWSAAVGAVLGILVVTGAIAASGTTRALFDVGPNSGVGVWHLASGTLAAAAGTTRAAFLALFGSVGGVGAALGTGLVIAAVVLVLGARAERQLLELRGCRRPSMAELRRLAQALQAFGAGLHQPDVPPFVVTDATRPVLRVHRGCLEVSTGLLDTLDDEELPSVVCRAVHQWRSGLGSWGALVVACGWPIFALHRLGQGFVDPEDDHAKPSAGSALVGLMVWPASVLVRHVLVPISDQTRQRAEYDADAAVARAGHGPGLAGALSKLSKRQGRSRGFDAVLAAGMPPVALRIERLGPTRPLDAFFREPDEGSTAARQRGRRAVAGIGVALVLLAAGAAADASNATATREAAARAAAAFTVSYLDGLFSPGADDNVVTAFVAPGSAARAEAEAGATALGLTAVLAGTDAARSDARATGCRFAAATSPAGDRAQVVVQARWDYALDGVVHRALLTSDVGMAFVGGRWQPVSTPVVSVMKTGQRPWEGSGEIPCR